MIVVGVVFLLLAAVLLIVGALATTRRLPGNSIVGLRVPEVRKTQEAWDVSHAVAGPFWLLGGLALLFGGFLSFVVSGWGWILPVVLLLVAVVAISVGANSAARMAVLFDQQAKAANEEAGGGCGNDCNCGSAAEPAPQVDVDALRRAASAADES